MKRPIFVIVALCSVLAKGVVASPPKKPVKGASKAVKSGAKKKSGSRVVTTASGLKYVDYRVGKGKVAKAGQNVTVQYRGVLMDGTLFDQSYGRAPFSFVLGAGNVIAGWDQGVAGMREGGKRLLQIPSDLAYGPSGQGSIPPNAPLKFEVVLLKVG